MNNCAAHEIKPVTGRSTLISNKRLFLKNKLLINEFSMLNNNNYNNIRVFISLIMIIALSLWIIIFHIDQIKLMIKLHYINLVFNDCENKANLI